MALDFSASTTVVNHGSGASIDNLDAQTWLFWLNATAINSANKRFMWKNSGSSGVQILQGPIGGTQGRMRYARSRATTGSDATSPNDTLVVGTWQGIAITDQDGVSPKIYLRTLATALAELGSYAVQTTGSGAPADESAQTLYIGGRNAAGVEGDVIIAYWAVFNSILTLADMASWFKRPRAIIGAATAQCFSRFNNTTSIVDWSGNGNTGTPENSPTLVANPPIDEGELTWGETAGGILTPTPGLMALSA